MVDRPTARFVDILDCPANGRALRHGDLVGNLVVSMGFDRAGE
jgi:hypothetical protein